MAEAAAVAASVEQRAEELEYDTLIDYNIDDTERTAPSSSAVVKSALENDSRKSTTKGQSMVWIPKRPLPPPCYYSSRLTKKGRGSYYQTAWDEYHVQPLLSSSSAGMTNTAVQALMWMDNHRHLVAGTHHGLVVIWSLSENEDSRPPLILRLRMKNESSSSSNSPIVALEQLSTADASNSFLVVVRKHDIRLVSWSSLMDDGDNSTNDHDMIVVQDVMPPRPIAEPIVGVLTLLRGSPSQTLLVLSETNLYVFAMTTALYKNGTTTDSKYSPLTNLQDITLFQRHRLTTTTTTRRATCLARSGKHTVLIGTNSSEVWIYKLRGTQSDFESDDSSLLTLLKPPIVLDWSKSSCSLSSSWKDRMGDITSMSCSANGQWWNIAATQRKRNQQKPSDEKSGGGWLVTVHGPSRTVVSVRETRETISCLLQQRSTSTASDELYAVGNHAVLSTYSGSSCSLDMNGIKKQDDESPKRSWISSPSASVLAMSDDDPERRGHLLAVGGVGNQVDLMEETCRVRTLTIPPIANNSM